MPARPTIPFGATVADRAPRILVVDDNLDSRLLIEDFLSMHRYDVSVVKAGDEAAVLLASDIHYDLVLLDLMLPQKDGLTVLKQLRAQGHGAKLPVVVASAFAEGPIEGAQAVLTKPIELNRLLAIVEQYAGKMRVASAP